MSLEEREKLFGLLQQGKSLRYCARVVGRSHTTLLREVKKNSCYGRSYLPIRAQRRHVRVTTHQRRKGPLKNPGVYLYVREHLRTGLSPQLICGRLVIDYPTDLSMRITPETIYQYIYATAKRRRDFTSYLTHSHRRRRTYTGRSVQKAP